MRSSDWLPDRAAMAPRDETAFSVVVPCYNEAEGVGAVLAALRECLRQAEPYEVIVVDDASTDGTPELLAAEQASNPALKVVRHQKNRGYGAALKTGLRHAASQVIVITDADGSYPPEAIPALVTQMAEADMVVGARAATAPGHLPGRRLPKAILTLWAASIAGTAIPDLNSGLRAFRKDVAARFLRVLPDGFSFTSTLTLALLRNRYRVTYLPIEFAHRLGTSKIHPLRDTLQIAQLILRTGMYFAPLRLLAPVVGMLALISLASLGHDLLILRSLTDTSLLLLFFTFNAGMFALLADMVDRRSSG